MAATSSTSPTPASPTTNRGGVPDGQFIVFSSDRDGANNRELYRMRLDGTDVVRLTNDLAQDQFPAYSLDGAQIAFASNRDGNL